MNKAVLIGRLTRDPDVRFSSEGKGSARYTLAVARKYKTEGQPEADFISCVTFGKGAEFAEKYLRQGVKIGVIGRIQTGSYTNRDGQKVYTTDVIVEEHEFVESKKAGASVPVEQAKVTQPYQDTEFVPVPDDMPEGELPFY